MIDAKQTDRLSLTLLLLLVLENVKNYNHQKIKI